MLFLRQNPDVSRGADDDGEKFASLLEKLQKDVRYGALLASVWNVRRQAGCRP